MNSARCKERGVGDGNTERGGKDDTEAQASLVRAVPCSGRGVKLRDVSKLRIAGLEELIDGERP